MDRSGSRIEIPWTGLLSVHVDAAAAGTNTECPDDTVQFAAARPGRYNDIARRYLGEPDTAAASMRLESARNSFGIYRTASGAGLSNEFRFCGR